MRAMWCDRRPVPLNRGARLLLPLCGIVGVWEPAAAAGGAIFTGRIDAFCVSEMMVKMLFFAMSWEFVTGRLETKLAKNPAYSEMLTKVYKELMILGFIGFMLVMTKEYGYTLSPDTMHCFEFCDLMVTICVLLYITTTAISCFFNHVTRRTWDRISLASVHDVCVDFEDHLEKLASPCGKIRYSLSSDWRAKADFKLVELLFKTKFHLEKNFDYMMYAKTVLEDNVVDLANISTWHWAGVCAMSLSIYFAGPGDFDPDNIRNPFQFESFAFLSNSSIVGGGDGRRRLGASEDTCVEPALPCGLNASDLQVAVDSLFSVTNNISNTSQYNETCSECAVPPPPLGISDLSDAKRQKIQSAIVYYGLFAWILVTLLGFINWLLEHKMNLILKYHGADQLSNMPNLLRHLEEHFSKSSAGIDEVEEQLIDIGEGDDDDDGEGQQDEDEHHMMVFKRAGKDANDVLSWWMFRFLMFTTKMIQLSMCFYMGFYVCHMNLRLQMVRWEYLAILGFPDDKSETGYNPGSNSLMPRYGVHVWLIIPIAIVVFRQLPIFTRQISLLVGVLHLHEEAANKVIQHMEVVKNIRRRIKLRLEKTKIIKGKKKLKKGMKQLALIENGEFQILSTLKHQDEADAGNETRLTRKEIQALLDQYKTETADKQLAAFMDRDAFKEYLQEPKQRQQTAQTAKTMLIAEGQGEEEDSITLRELVTFLVRAIAYACNIADEHGVQTTEITRVRDNVVNLSTVTEADFEEARLLARTKSLFRVVDSDKSGKLTRSELHRAFRKYRVPVSQSDMDTILRVMDPDQNGYITMEEWLDFMLSSDDSLEQETLCASQMQSKQNAEAGGDGIFEYIKYGEEAIDAIPGGIYFTKTLKDPIGAVVHVSNSTLHAVTNPVRAIEHDLLPVMGMPEQRKPLTGQWDPAGNSANARGGRPLTHEVELDEDDDLGDDDLGNTMENPLAGQPETEPEIVTDTV